MIGPDSALIVIDIQNDFCPGGALAVPDGDSVVDAANTLARDFPVCVFTQDWHPIGHASFASSHPGKRPFESVEVEYGTQTLWPDHCVQGSAGAEFHPGLDTDQADLIIRKGFRMDIDSYSAFYENDRVTPTGLEGYLKTRRVQSVACIGLATDFCVYYSALDAVGLGFSTTVIENCCRAIDLDNSLQAAREGMLRAGIALANWPQPPN